MTIGDVGYGDPIEVWLPGYRTEACYLPRRKGHGVLSFRVGIGKGIEAVRIHGIPVGSLTVAKMSQIIGLRHGYHPHSAKKACISTGGIVESFLLMSKEVSEAGL